MRLLWQFICPILLALSFLSTTAQAQGMTTIGYRTVSHAEALSINLDHRPTGQWFDGEGPPQLGDGFFYMTNKSPSWRGAEPDDWYCVVKADTKRLNDIGKIWIPHYWDVLIAGAEHETIDLWAGDERAILGYINWRRLPNPEQALRFSWVAAWIEEEMDQTQPLQMVIPTDVLVNNLLELWAQCFRTPEAQERYSSSTVNWSEWEDIVGDPGDGPEPLLELFDLE